MIGIFDSKKILSPYSKPLKLGYVLWTKRRQ